MQKTKNISAGKWVALVIALLFMFATKFIPSPADLSQAGFQVLGILIGAIILFLTWGTGFPSMMIVFALMTVDGLSAAKVTQATFGNNTVVFLVFCMMLAACLTKSGAARRIAIWFLTNKLARKSPWWTVIMFLPQTTCSTSCCPLRQPFLSCCPSLLRSSRASAFRRKTRRPSPWHSCSARWSPA